MPNTLNIPQDILKNLYIDQRLSSRKIAKLYCCAYSTIDRKIRLANLPTRNLAEAYIVYPRKDFSGNLIEKAYLIGFRIGDLRVRKCYKNSQTLTIDCASTKAEQINLIQILFSPYGRVWVSKPNKRGAIQIQTALNTSFNFLFKPQLEEWVIRKKEYFFSFLAGFTDADGSIFISNNQAIYSLGNYNFDLLQKIQSALIKFKVEPYKVVKSKRKGLIAPHGYRYNQDYWMLRVQRKEEVYKLLKFLEPYLKHTDKVKQVNLAFKNIEERNILYGPSKRKNE